MIKVLIIGANGRMGRAMVRSGYKHTNIEIIGGVGPKGRDYIGMDLGALVGLGRNIGAIVVDDMLKLIEKCDVVLECTKPEVTAEVLRGCVNFKKAFVTGTTGLSDEERKALERAGEIIPVLPASNTSNVAHLLFRLIRTVARELGMKADVDIIEMHGNYKLDAPSGTAKEIGELIAKEIGFHLEDIAEYGRKGKGFRRPHTIHFASVRSGEIPTMHQVIFGFENERLELVHHGYNMIPFADGMIKAAVFLSDKDPGCYDFKQVLELEPQG